LFAYYDSAPAPCNCQAETKKSFPWRGNYSVLTLARPIRLSQTAGRSVASCSIAKAYSRLSESELAAEPAVYSSLNKKEEESPMQKVRLRLLVLLSCLLPAAHFCQAQGIMLDLPRQSQHAVVEQRIGITDITINYHRPLANGRQIWGKVVPYGQVWRAG